MSKSDDTRRRFLRVQFQNAVRITNRFGRDLVIVVDVIDLNFSFGGNAFERDLDRLIVFLFINGDEQTFDVARFVCRTE